jgi:hypothetical protein
MATGRNRAVFLNGTNSYLMEGDSEKDDERFFFLRNGSRNGCALPVLLGEGWTLLQMIPLDRSARADDNYGCAVVILMAPGS